MIILLCALFCILVLAIWWIFQSNETEKPAEILFFEKQNDFSFLLAYRFKNPTSDTLTNIRLSASFCTSNNIYDLEKLYEVEPQEEVIKTVYLPRNFQRNNVTFGFFDKDYYGLSNRKGKDCRYVLYLKSGTLDETIKGSVTIQ